MIDLEIDDVIQDNDKRMAGRQLVIVGLEGPYVFARNRHDNAYSPRRVRIRRDRIADHFRSYGFTRIMHGTAKAAQGAGD